MIDNPQNWRLSLMICDKSLEVVARAVVGESSIIYSSIDIDTSAVPALEIEDRIYANPLLLQPFGKTDIVIRTDRFQLLPPDVADDVDAVDSVLDMLPHPDGRPIPMLAPIDSRNMMVAMLDKGVSNFLSRTFFQVKPTTHLSVLSSYFTHRNRLGNSGKLYVNIYGDYIDVLAFDSMGLTVANTFICGNDNDAAYYILASAKQIGFDFNSDEIFISGHTERRSSLMNILRSFVSNVMPAIFPSTIYNGDRNALVAPFELIILPLCE